jgi:hypothetical protein
MATRKNSHSLGRTLLPIWSSIVSLRAAYRFSGARRSIHRPPARSSGQRVRAASVRSVNTRSEAIRRWIAERPNTMSSTA